MQHATIVLPTVPGLLYQEDNVLCHLVPGLSVINCFLPVQNVTSNLNDTVVQFKTSALSEMKPAWEDVQRAADSFANTSLAVASQGVSGAVHFGDEKWTALQAAPGPAAALAPVSAPSQVAVTGLYSCSAAGPSLAFLSVPAVTSAGRPARASFTVGMHRYCYSALKF